jgi:guanylate kinase
VSDDTEHRGRIFVLAAPSGGGKTSLIRALIERNRRLGPSVSHTTRPARPGERHGEHYYFVDEPEFRSLIDEDAFLEYALVFGDYKGTSKREVQNRTAAGCDVLLDIDWQGARQVRESMPDSRSIFILPPSLETLKERLARRGQDSPDVIERRMRKARSEISHWDEFDFVVVNDDFEDAVSELQSIIRHGRPVHPVAPGKLRELVAELLQDG